MRNIFKDDRYPSEYNSGVKDGKKLLWYVLSWGILIGAIIGLVIGSVIVKTPQ